MDLFPSRVRFRNIFGQEGDDSTPNITKNIFPVQHSTAVNKTAMDDSPDQNDPARRLMDLYNEPSPAVDRLSQYVNQQPDKEDYKPSKKRRLGAILAGTLSSFADPGSENAVVKNILDSPYDDAVEHWTRGRVPIENAARAETTARTQKINSLKDYIQAKRQDLESNSLIKSRESTARHEGNVDAETLARDQANETAATNTLAETKREHDLANTRGVASDAETARFHRESAEIARKNAETSASKVAILQKNADSLSAYRDHLISKVKPNDKTPAAQKTAREVGILDTVLKPGNSQKYGDFYDQDDKGRVVIKPPSRGFFTSDTDFNQSMLDYAAFTREIEDAANKRLGLKSNTTVVPPKNDNPPPPAAKVVRRHRP